MNIPASALALLLFVSAPFSTVYAQGSFKKATRNYKEATVITAANDTLQGKIDYKQWRQNPYAVTFMQEGKEERDFTAREIQEFRVEGDTYRAAIVDLDISPIDLGKLQDSPFPTIVKDSALFLLLLVQGELNLYYMEDAANKEHFFYQKPGKPVIELGFFRYYHDPVYRRFTSKETYKGQLRVLAMDCEAQQLDPNIEYQTKYMLSFFVRYNSCLTGEAPVQSNSSASKGRFELAASAGVNYTHLYLHERMYKSDRTNVVYTGTANIVLPVVGLSVNYYLPRGLDKYSLGSTLLYVPLQLEHEEVVNYYSRPRTYVDRYMLNSIQWMGSFRYSVQWPNGIRYYVSAGPSLVYLLDASLHKTIYSQNSRGETVPSASYNFEYNKLMGGANVGVGAALKRYSFEIRLNRELANAHSGDGFNRATSFTGLFSYAFIK
jgi:hypothetical protein